MLHFTPGPVKLANSAGQSAKIIKNLAVKKEKMFSTSKLPTQIEAAAYSEPNIFDIKDVAQRDKNMKT